MPQYLLNVIQPDGDRRPSPTSSSRSWQDLARCATEMKDAGVWVFTGGLHPPSTATVVRHEDGEVLMTDGPFAEGQRAHRRLHGHRRRPTSTPRSAGAARMAERDRRCRSRSARCAGLDWTESNVSSASEYGRAVAVLVRVFGDIDVAEEAVQDAFAAAVAALARRRAAAEPGRLDHHHGAQPRRSTGCAARRRARTATRRRPRCCGAASRTPRGGGSRARRPAAADLHLLSPVARARRRRSR